MDKVDQLRRTKAFSLRVMRLVDAMPDTISSRAVARQLIRCATSVSINYRAACRAKTPADFLAKLKTCEEESDETVGWLELVIESGMIPDKKLADLLDEARQINAMLTAACITTSERLSAMTETSKRKPLNQARPS